MNTYRFAVEHVQQTSGKPFVEVTEGLLRQLGAYDPAAIGELAAGADVEAIRSRLEAMVGTSGFALFGTVDHGALLRLVGAPRKAVQYVIGNPLYGVQMTQHDVRVALYVPLRVLVYEDKPGRTCVEYDRPSSLLGQLGNAQVAGVAAMLDQKLEALIAGAIG